MTKHFAPYGLMVLAFAAGFDGAAIAGVLHVSPSGDNANPGTQERPTVYRAAPGARVILDGGCLIPPSEFVPVDEPSIRDRLVPEARDSVVQADLKALGITDYGDSGQHVFGNVFYETGANGAVKYHGGQFNEFINNVVVDCAMTVKYQLWNQERWTAFLKEASMQKKRLKDVNILTPPYSTRYPKLARIFESPYSRESHIEERNYVTTATDSAFADGSKLDFRIRDLEAVHDQVPGFEPIPFERIGLYEDRHRRIVSAKSLRSERPATSWEDALLAGNGLIGVMEYGDPLNEVFVLNCHKFVYPNGAPEAVPDMSDQLEPMRDLMLDGRIGEGWAQYHRTLLERRGITVDLTKPYAGMVWSQSFHPGYVLRMRMPSGGEISGYERRTDYETGEILVRWSDARGRWERRTFVSRADNVIVNRLTAPSDTSGLIDSKPGNTGFESSQISGLSFRRPSSPLQPVRVRDTVRRIERITGLHMGYLSRSYVTASSSKNALPRCTDVPSR